MIDGQPERTIVNPITDVDSRINEFCTAFSGLREDFRTKALIHTTLVLGRMELVQSQLASSVDLMRGYLQFFSYLSLTYDIHPECKEVLKPEEMDPMPTFCVGNTRRNIINDIMAWAADDSTEAKKVLWIYGLAGTGKSTLSSTIARNMHSLHRLGAFFLFNRDKPLRDSRTLIRTLAYRLADFDPCFRAAISPLVKQDSNITISALEYQFQNLLIYALKSVEWPRGPIVLIIDALDECGREADRRDLLQTLSKGFSDLPSFIRIVVVSRPEADIQRALESHSHVRRYHLDTDSVTNKEDVSEYIRHRLEAIRIKDRCLGDHWPSEDSIRCLATRAGGLFIWASTACLYIDGYAPNQQLSQLLNKQPEDFSSGPFAELDSLYGTGLQSADFWNNRSFRSDCCNILGAILCARVPLSFSVIDGLLALPQDTPSWKSVSRLRCFLDVDKTERIRILHPSFHDYLSERCGDKPWSINLERHNKELALRCIKLLDRELRENICDMTLPYLNQKKTVPEAISYACKFWIEHVCLISTVDDDILNEIYNFLDKHLLHWMEAMAILKSHDCTIRSIDNLMKWLQVCPPIWIMGAFH
jgi:hypothetical protein